jgi:protein-tyrosine phosphatase
LRILVVCTANICRSPVVAMSLARALATRGHDVIVSSAGTHGGLLEVPGDTLRAAAEVGLELADHRSRALTRQTLADDGADLIVTMTREQLRAVVGLDPGAWRRTFTLKELARRGLDAVGEPDFAKWAAATAAGRKPSDMMAPSEADDLADPYGGSFAEHRQMVAAVEMLTRQIAQMVPVGQPGSSAAAN